GRQLADVFERLKPPPGGDAALDAAPFDALKSRLAASFDREFGGFGAAPKFPHPATLDRLLRQWHASAAGEDADAEALFMASLTLTRMAEGGICDQLGGGFCRYSVDRYWQIPHFEKMLYDNGALLAVYAQAAGATGEELFARVARETARWLMDDMRAANGGCYSSRDADSEGEEGKYYVWTPDEVRALLDEHEYLVAARHYGLDAAANFEGRWHLSVREPLAGIAAKTGESLPSLRQRLERARWRLLEARSRREPPARDEKQLTSWNALAIRGLAIAGRIFGEPHYVAAAVAAADFLREQLFRDGRLLASYKDGHARFPAYLDDHAFLLDALLELLQADWHGRHLHFAVALAELLLTRFIDARDGGFYFTADDHESLIDRPKPLADEAMPSGNGIAAFALQRLGFMLGETRYLDAAEATLKCAQRALADYPQGHVSLLTALEEYLAHPEIIVIRGGSDEIAEWRDGAARAYAPRRLVFAIDAAADDLPGALADRPPIPGETVAYRCVGDHCSLPITRFEALAEALHSKSSEWQ
ncbi:MAG: thioredoxin domain-containing protein, partial [Steroidobacteraceae bacterium]